MMETTVKEWPQVWRVCLSEAPDACYIDLPLISGDSGIRIYALDLMGKTAHNSAAAKSLCALIEKTGLEFDVLITAESKAIALTNELAKLVNNNDYVVLRKSPKLYMPDPVMVQVQSITTKNVQYLYLGRDKADELAGKKAIVVDDVVSTGGTMDAILDMADKVGFEAVLIATVLTEGDDRSEYRGIPLVKLDHIPLPDMLEL
jgi:adenine phosphoribosyltransferase